MSSFYSFLASLGFAVLFNVPKNRLFYAALAGGIGGAAYSIALYLGTTETVSLLYASIFLSLASEIMARILRCPSTMFLISALIPFVPGGGAYYTVLSLIEKNNDMALYHGLNTITQAGAIVLGCVLVTGAFSMIRSFETAAFKKRCHKDR